MRKAVFSLFAVCTIDGKIAKNSKHMTDWSSKEDKTFLHRHLDLCDVVIIGKNTFEVATGPLSKRNCIVFSSSAKGVEQKNPNLVFLNPQEEDLLKFLEKKNYSKVAVLGGTKCFSYFLENNLVDKIYLTIEPLVFGGGLPLFEAKTDQKKFVLILVQKLNTLGTILLEYKAV